MNTVSPPVTPAQPEDTHPHLTGKFLMTVLISAGVIIAICLYVYGIFWQRNHIVSQFNQSIQRLSLLSQNQVDTTEYYTMLAQINNDIEKPQTNAFIWEMHKQYTRMNTLDSEVAVVYEELIALEKKELTDQFSRLEGKLSLNPEFVFPQKQEMITFLERYQEITTDDIDEIDAIRKEVDIYHAIVDSASKTFVLNKLNEMDNLLSESTYYTIPSRDSLVTFSASTRALIEQANSDALDLIPLLPDIDSNQELLSEEVEAAKRNLIISSVNASRTEVQTMIQFFSSRDKYDKEIRTLQEYLEKADEISKLVDSDVAPEQIDARVNKELYPLLTRPRETKLAIEQKEQQERLLKQQRLEKAGIPMPPVDVPKLIYISISDQRLYAYENGISIFSKPVPVTTGKAGFDTVKGQFAIYQKGTNVRLTSPFPNIYYDNVVTYWMPFFQGYGIHDAYWREIYGTQDYGVVGSHGCVNVPYAEVEQLFNWAEVGTTVYVD